jgi:hypothetical protein
MSKKIQIYAFALAGLLVLSGCSNSANQNGTPAASNSANNIENNNTASDQTAADTTTGNSNGGQAGTLAPLNSCSVENVSLSNYGDPGKRLSNCFVEYPGEPTREDKSYYIVEDICGQFTQAFMENMLGRKITRIEPSNISSVNGCSYYLDGNEYVMLVLDYLAIENQRTGQEQMGRKVEKNPKIPMDNFVVTEDDGAINDVYFILSPQKFLRLERSSKAALSNDQIMDLSAQLGAAIKGYK